MKKACSFFFPLILFCAVINYAFADGNGTLGVTYNVSKCGLGYVQASTKITNRNSAGGTGIGLPATPVTIAGIPAGAVIEQAFVWCILSYNTGPSNPTYTVTNPAAVTTTYTGVKIGSAAAKCWSEVETRSYRCDVTPAISGNGNYVIDINLPANDMDGLTLFVIYSVPTAAFLGNLVVWDGCISSGGPAVSFPLNGFTACAASTSPNANGFIMDSDFQLGGHNVVINSVSQGGALGIAASFYECYVANTSVTAGQSSATYGASVVTGVDCYAILAAGLYFKTTTCGICPLPLSVSYVDFTAKCAEKHINLNWSTAQEKNAQQYIVERGTGITFEEIGSLAATGNTNTKQNYNFTDSKPYGGINYYRLKQVDFDGKADYSNIISATLPHNSIQIVNTRWDGNMLNAIIDNEDQLATISISLVDINGRSVHTQQQSLQGQGNQTISINTDNVVARGVYFLLVESAGKIAKQVKVVKTE